MFDSGYILILTHLQYAWLAFPLAAVAAMHITQFLASKMPNIPTSKRTNCSNTIFKGYQWGLMRYIYPTEWDISIQPLPTTWLMEFLENPADGTSSFPIPISPSDATWWISTGLHGDSLKILRPEKTPWGAGKSPILRMVLHVFDQ